MTLLQRRGTLATEPLSAVGQSFNQELNVVAASERLVA